MSKLKKISVCLFSGIVLFGTISFARTGTVNAPNGLVLRESASKSANPITTVSDDSKVEIIEESGQWYKVKYGNYEGYMFAEYIEEEQASNEIVAQEEQNTTTIENENDVETSENQENTIKVEVENYPQIKAVKSNLKIYNIPSVTAKVTGNVEESKTVTVNYVLNDWANITYEGIQGWARNYFIDNEITSNNTTNAPEENTTTFENRKGYIDVSTSANLRETASTSANVITTLTRNTEVLVVGEEGEFYKIEYKEYKGYIAKSLISDKALEVTSRSSSERQDSVEEKPQSNIKEDTQVVPEKVINSDAGETVVSYAKKYLGYNYVSGGTTPSAGFDCTGFTYYIYNACGYSLSRSCSVQAKSGTEVSRENLQPGDLLLFNNGGNGSIGHVGIYIGDGSFIHAANARRGVVTDTINSGYYNTYYYSARRIVE